MKSSPRFHRSHFLAAALMLNAAASAATYQWDVNGATAGLGGAGTWNTGNAFWDLMGTGIDDGTDTATGYTFTTADTAIFGGTVGAVALGNSITVNQLWFKTTGYTMSGSTITLGGATPTITTDSGVSASISSIFTGTGGLTKNGTGTLTLTGLNNFTGNVVIDQGTLVTASAEQYNTLATTSALGNPSTVGRTVTVNNGGTLQFGGANQFGGPQSGKYPNIGLVINAGGNVVAFNGNMNTLGAVTLNGGTLTTANGYNVDNQSFYLTGGVTVGGSTASTISAGGTTNNGIHLGTNTIFDVADATGDANADLTVSAVLRNRPGNDTGGAATLTKTGAGTLKLTGDNTFTGNVVINQGVLLIAGPGHFSGTTTASSLGNTTTVGRTVTVNNGGTLQFGGENQFGGPVGYPKLGLIINAGGNVNAFATNMNTLGAVTLNGGTLTTANGYNGNNQSFYITGGVTVGGSTASTISAGGTTNNGIHLASSTTFNVADATGDANADLTVSAVLRNRPSNDTSGAATLTKTGAGTMVLSAANAYTGATTISGGTLLVNGSIASATSVASGARLGGSGTVSGAVTVDGGVTGGTIRGGTGLVTTDSLTVGGKVTLASGSIVELALGSAVGNNHSTLKFNGTGDVLTSGLVFSFLDLGATAGTYTGLITGVDTAADLTGWSITNAGWVGTFSQVGTNINLNLTAVPEPSTYGLIGAGALAAVAFVRRRRKLAIEIA